MTKGFLQRVAVVTKITFRHFCFHKNDCCPGRKWSGWNYKESRIVETIHVRNLSFWQNHQGLTPAWTQGSDNIEIVKGQPSKQQK